MANLNLTDKKEILSTLEVGENGIKLSISENTVKAYVRYFKQAINDIKTFKNDSEMVADITKSINKKLEFVKNNFTGLQLQEILVLFTDSMQGKKRIREGLMDTNKNDMIFKAWFDKFGAFKIAITLDEYTVSTIKVLRLIYR